MRVARAFVDTNILLRASIQSLPLHSESLALIEHYRSSGFEFWISTQVIREFLVQVTRQQSGKALLLSEEITHTLTAWNVLFGIAEDSKSVYNKLLKLIQVVSIGGKQIHDANIVATMLVNNIGTLLTQNLADMRRFEPYIQIATLPNVT